MEKELYCEIPENEILKTLRCEGLGCGEKAKYIWSDMLKVKTGDAEGLEKCYIEKGVNPTCLCFECYEKYRKNSQKEVNKEYRLIEELLIGEYKCEYTEKGEMCGDTAVWENSLIDTVKVDKNGILDFVTRSYELRDSNPQTPMYLCREHYEKLKKKEGEKENAVTDRKSEEREGEEKPDCSC